METKEVLGLDVGLKRTGIARASSVATLAEPMDTKPTAEIPKFLSDYEKKHELEAVAIGLPRNLEGRDTKQTAWVRDWVDKLKETLNVPLYWQDEALTTVKAEDMRTDVKRKGLDAVSAAVILQDFLDSPQTSRTMC